MNYKNKNLIWYVLETSSNYNKDDRTEYRLVFKPSYITVLYKQTNNLSLQNIPIHYFALSILPTSTLNEIQGKVFLIHSIVLLLELEGMFI